MSRECVAVALSPHPYFEMGKTYVVHFGADGNLSTVLRRRLPNATEAVDATFPGRVCCDSRFVAYWILLQDGVLSAGIGNIPGQKCVAKLDDSLYHQLRSGIDAVKFIGIGNSALGRGARDLRARNVRILPIPPSFGVNGIPCAEISPVNIDDPSGRSGVGGPTPEARLLAEYEKECEKAKARAKKFGTDYKQPPPDAFFKWSEVRKLRANPERGFITGIDVMSPEEREKAERRKERFVDENRKRDLECGKGEDTGEEDQNEDEFQDGKGSRETVVMTVENAWDNESLVGLQRIDPPEHLYAISSTTETKGAEDPEKVRAVCAGEKVHIFSIDWVAFKQIRSEDIMAHFADYGPSYVEWLGELSCNVHFEDKYSAARAMAGLSMELPSPPPEGVTKEHQVKETDVKGTNVVKMQYESNDMEEEYQSPTQSPTPDLGCMGWRLCLHPIRKTSNDRYGKRGTRGRVLMRVATSEDVLVERPTERPRPPPGFTTKRVLGPGSDFDTRWRNRRGGRADITRKTKRQRKGGESDRNSHNLGDNSKWKRDRYHDDSQDDNGWQDDERWQRDKYDDLEDSYDDDDAMVQESGDGKISRTRQQLPAALEQGLKSSRPGFSVEEMKKERQAKRRAAIG